MYRSQPYAGILRGMAGENARLKIKGSLLFSMGDSFEMVENLSIGSKMGKSFVKLYGHLNIRRQGNMFV